MWIPCVLPPDPDSRGRATARRIGIRRRRDRVPWQREPIPGVRQDSSGTRHGAACRRDPRPGPRKRATVVTVRGSGPRDHAAATRAAALMVRVSPPAPRDDGATARDDGATARDAVAATRAPDPSTRKACGGARAAPLTRRDGSASTLSLLPIYRFEPDFEVSPVSRAMGARHVTPCISSTCGLADQMRRLRVVRMLL